MMMRFWRWGFIIIIKMGLGSTSTGWCSIFIPWPAVGSTGVITRRPLAGPRPMSRMRPVTTAIFSIWSVVALVTWATEKLIFQKWKKIHQNVHYISFETLIFFQKKIYLFIWKSSLSRSQKSESEVGWSRSKFCKIEVQRSGFLIV